MEAFYATRAILATVLHCAATYGLFLIVLYVVALLAEAGAPLWASIGVIAVGSIIIFSLLKGMMRFSYSIAHYILLWPAKLIAQVMDASFEPEPAW